MITRIVDRSRSNAISVDNPGDHASSATSPREHGCRNRTAGCSHGNGIALSAEHGGLWTTPGAAPRVAPRRFGGPGIVRSLRGMVRWGRVVAAIAAGVGLLLVAPQAWAHEERPVSPPDGSGRVPEYRGAEPDLLVCKTDRADFERRIAGFSADLKARNVALFERCQREGFRHLQEAVDEASRPGMNIAILPGVYREEPSLEEPAGDCANLQAPRAKLGHLILSYEQQQACPHNQNLVAIMGVRDLQIEGTGQNPLDVIVDAQYKRLNGIRADLADGIYLRNFAVQRTTFNSVYVLGTDGFVIDRMLTRWNDEYGFLTFASDHGLYTDCESYGNGDSGVYPGGTADLNRDRGHQVIRYAIEVQRCRSHHNMVGYSGTAGDSVWVHDSEFFDNMAGASMDSAFPNHPGLPQNHALFEHNLIRDNNQDFYRFVRDGTCARPAAERGYEDGTVCPAVGLPVGTGIITAGGNYNVFRENRISGHHRSAFALFAVPAFLRSENTLSRQFDTSHHNRYLGNELDGNAATVWWDGQGTGNCWQPAAGAGTPRLFPACGSAPDDVNRATHRVLAEPAKLATLYACSGYDLRQRRVPGGCDWYGATGLRRVDVQLALASSVLLGAAGLLLWWVRLRRERTALVLTAIGLLGLALDVPATTDGTTVLPGIALLLMGAWWAGLGVLLWLGYRRHRGFAVVSLLLGAFALLGVVDKLVYPLPYLPVGPEWVRGLLANVWFIGALALLAARTPRDAEDEAPEPADQGVSSAASSV
jgi:Right handed beta helix region